MEFCPGCDATIFTTGYTPTDVNGDYSTDLTEVTIASNNSAAFIGSIIP